VQLIRFSVDPARSVFLTSVGLLTFSNMYILAQSTDICRNFYFPKCFTAVCWAVYSHCTSFCPVYIGFFRYLILRQTRYFIGSNSHKWVNPGIRQKGSETKCANCDTVWLAVNWRRSVPKLIECYRYNNWRITDRKRSTRKTLWSFGGTVSAVPWRDWGNRPYARSERPSS
jgi:hypothetical protein